MESTDARISCLEITQNKLPYHEMSEKIPKKSVQISKSIGILIVTMIKQGEKYLRFGLRLELSKLSFLRRSSVQGPRTYKVFTFLLFCNFNFEV